MATTRHNSRAHQRGLLIYRRRRRSSKQQDSITSGSPGHDYDSPQPGFNISRRILHEEREQILSEGSINAAGSLCLFGWHIDRYGLRLAGPRYALWMDPPRLLIVDSEFSHRNRAVSAGEYRIPGVVVIGCVLPAPISCSFARHC